MHHIKEWNICKNLKAHDKERMTNMLLEDPLADVSLVQSVERNPLVDLRRLDRYERDLKRGALMSSQTLARRQVMKQTKLANIARAIQRVQTSTDRSLISSSVGPPAIGQHRPVIKKTRYEHTTKTDSDTTPALQEFHAIDNTQQDCSMSNLLSNAKRSRYLPQEVSNPLSPKEVILISTKTLVESSVQHDLLKEATSIGEFWLDIQNAMYMLKSRGTSGHGAWRILQNACDTLPACIDSGLLSLKHIYSTLSPLNLKTHVQLGRQITLFIAQVFQLRYGSNHPLYRICTALSKDLTQADTSLEGLEVLLHTLGLTNSHRIYQLETQKALISTYRRSGNYKKAHDLCSTQIDMAMEYHGQHSDQARAARNQLAHILEQSGYVEGSILLCEEILFGDGNSITPFILDRQTVWAMENLAEYHQRTGDIAASKVLLEQAYCIAVRIWTVDCSSAAIIVDKLKCLESLPLQGQRHRQGRTSRFISLFASTT